MKRIIFCLFTIVLFIQFAQSQIITTVAGNGTYGYSGDGGAAVTAQLSLAFLASIAIDGSGNLYIADEGDYRIRKVDALGIITTIAGSGIYGYSGDGGAATAAKLGLSTGVAIDGGGNLYIADYTNYSIRKVDALGIITTIAGNGTSGYSGDGGFATAASLGNIAAVAIDGNGNLYIADYTNHSVRKVNTLGIITTIAGNGTNGYNGDNGLATEAELSDPAGIAVSANGNLYIADAGNNCIRKVDTLGIITTVAGNGTFGYSGDGGSATAAQLKFPVGITIDSSNSLFIADEVNNCIRKVDASGIITTIAGNGIPGYSGDGSASITAELDYPVGVAIDGDGNLYVVDRYNNRIRKISASNQIFITSTIQTNTSFASNNITLWSGSIDTQPTTLKICADASTATKVKFINNTGISINNIRILMSSDPTGAHIDSSGQFINYQISGDTVTATYQHPKFLSSLITDSFRSDSFRIVDITNPATAIFTIPVNIYRAPVLLVHGLWGSAASFTAMKQYLDNGAYPPVLTKCADYSNTNNRSFAVNQNVVPTEINILLDRVRSSHFSAGKVDVVGHSMGGLLARSYLQSNAYLQKQDIHKLITLNTPHSGSQIGNLMTNQNSSNSTVARAIAHLLNNSSEHNFDVDGGAVADLAVNSDAMQYLNSPAVLSNNVVPAHAIISKTTVDQYVTQNFLIPHSSLLLAFDIALAPAIDVTSGVNEGVAGTQDLLNYLFYNNANDFVVDTASQSGGLQALATTTIPLQMHIGSPDNVNIQFETLRALNTNSTDPVYFSQTGFSPVPENTHYKLSNDNKVSKITDGNITIGYPATGQSFDPGDAIPVNISSNSGISKTIFMAIDNADSVYVLDTDMVNGIINYTVPADAFGSVKMIAFGYDSSDLVGYDTVTVNINQTALLDSITCSYDTIRVQVNNIASIPLTAHFNNGYQYTVDYNNGVSYQLANTTYTHFYHTDMLWGVQEGNTSVTVNYLGKSLVVPVIVFPQDTTIHIDTSEATAVKNINPVTGSSAPLKISPNPNNGTFTIGLEVNKGERVTVDIYNELGKKIFTQQDRAITNNYSKSISLKEAPGAYYIKVSAKSKSYNGKVVLIK